MHKIFLLCSTFWFRDSSFFFFFKLLTSQVFIVSSNSMEVDMSITSRQLFGIWKKKFAMGDFMSSK